uniref:Rieske domain-containing protein n=1 Tax=Ananas comosus var. bracteatus TaxID=296719 RepID=A0A6V7PAX6_ANACO|nr:unnamed protein product [Ananas comosus var. bracteatus]
MRCDRRLHRRKKEVQEMRNQSVLTTNKNGTSPPLLLFSLLPLSLKNPRTTHFTSLATISPPKSTSLAQKALRRSEKKRFCAHGSAAAAAEEVVIPKEVEEVVGDRDRVEYDWREEWYPLYLSAEVPADAALGLTVFDKQVVLYRDADGTLRCHTDRCPHRLAKLSEGQLVDGKLECLYHGWQFDGNGKCVKIPQLPEGAKIPRSACVRTYEVRDSQGVVWIWMSEKNPPNVEKLPWFEHYARPGFVDNSTIHELPYDHSILLENLMDPAHVPISHDRTDWTAKREDAQPLLFTVVERNHRGFAGRWGRSRNPALMNFLRFQAPCVLSNDLEFVDKNGVQQYFSGLFLCRPAGQGKSMLIVRFGGARGAR